MRKAPIIIGSVLLLCCAFIAGLFRMGDKRDKYINNYNYTINTVKPTYVTSNTSTSKVIPAPDYDDDPDYYDNSNNNSGSGTPQLPGTGTSAGLTIPSDLEELIMLPFDEAFALVVGTTDPGYTYANIKAWNNENYAKLQDVQSRQAVTISVPIWTWAAPGTNDLTKKSTNLNITLNKAIAELATAAFTDIYNSPDKPVFIIGLCGSYNLRAMGSGDNKKASGHAFGTAIDLNWDSMCNGKGNRMDGGKLSPTYQEWTMMPECQSKYEVFYEGSTVVKIFKGYGFQWGGDWNTTDGMHFSFIGDNGEKAREKGQENYRNYH